MPVTLKSPRQIRRLRESGRFVAEAFENVKHRAVPAVIRPGDGWLGRCQGGRSSGILDSGLILDHQGASNSSEGLFD